MKHGKKSHPHGLPHLNDAKHPETGDTDQAALKAGAAAWQAKIDSGEYRLDVVSEEAISDTVDLLVVKRTKLK